MAIKIDNVPTEAIAEPQFNSRVTPNRSPTYSKEETEFEDRAQVQTISNLASSMKASGLLQPIKVRSLPEVGKYYLIFGSRRLKAARELKWATVPATIEDWIDNAVERELADVKANTIENLVRRNLSTYETARSLHALRGQGLTLPNMVDQFGYSKGYISNLITIIERGAPELITDWQDGHPLAKTDTLRELVMQEHEAQVSAWTGMKDGTSDELAEGNDDDSADDSDDSATPAPAATKTIKKYHIPKPRVAKLIKLIKTKGPTMNAKTVIETINYLVGESEGISGLITAPKAEPATTKPAAKTGKSKDNAK